MGVLSLLLDITRTESGVIAEVWDSDDAFGSPIASADGATPDEAVAALFASITIPFPEDGPSAAGARRRSAHRRTALGPDDEVDIGPWTVEVGNDDNGVFPGFSLGGWTAYAERTIYVNEQAAGTEIIYSSYIVVPASNDPEINPDRQFPLDLYDFSDGLPEGVEFDVLEFTEYGFRDLSGEVVDSDYEYGEGGYTWHQTEQQAMAEAERLARASESWLDDHVVPHPVVLRSL